MDEGFSYFLCVVKLVLGSIGKVWCFTSQYSGCDFSYLIVGKLDS